MSEMAWNSDQFHEDLFGESIDDTAVNALVRLKRLRQSDAGIDEYEPGDVQYERYIGEQFGYSHTRIHTFTAVFESLHSAVMRADSMSDYLHAIVARLVCNGIKQQSSSAGNTVTQLPPDRRALDAHAAKVWASSSEDRRSARAFGVYSFYVGRDIADVVFSPENRGETWSLGYEMSQDRVLMTLKPEVGAAWRPAP